MAAYASLALNRRNMLFVFSPSLSQSVRQMWILDHGSHGQTCTLAGQLRFLSVSSRGDTSYIAANIGVGKSLTFHEEPSWLELQLDISESEQLILTILATRQIAVFLDYQLLNTLRLCHMDV